VYALMAELAVNAYDDDTAINEAEAFIADDAV
jgi:hypothetical protein